MVAIWLGAGALALLAALYVAARAWRRPPAYADAEDAAARFRARRQEIEAEARIQGVDAEGIKALEEELALDVIASGDAGGEPRRPTAAAKPPLAPLLGGAVATAALALALYALWGEPNAPVFADLAQRLGAAAGDPDAMAELAELERALAARVTRRPDDADALFHLGHARLVLKHYRGAASVFADLHALVGANEQVDLAWAQASYRAAGDKLTPEVRQVVERVLELHPEHPHLLELLAVAALRAGDFAAGAGYLARALRQEMPASRRKLLEETLALAEAHRDADAAAGAPSVADEGPASAVVVTVSLGVDVAPSVPVFVIARDPARPGPPVAVRRLTAGDLPARIELTDADAMLPGASLSALAEVEVVARASLGGAPTAQSGDVQSRVATVRPGDQPAALRIDQTMP